MKKREIVLKPENVKAILAEAKKVSLRDYLLLRTMVTGDFRVGEIVGSDPRKRIKFCKQCGKEASLQYLSEIRDNGVGHGLITKEVTCRGCGTKWESYESVPSRWIPMERNVKGLQIQDLRDGGVWVEGKGSHKLKDPAPPVLVPLPQELLSELKEFIGKRKEGRIFELSIGRVEQMSRFYAQKAGIADWKMVHPHRFRHFTTTQIARKHGILAARDIARHKNIGTTNRYVAELPDDEKRAIIQSQEDLISV